MLTNKNYGEKIMFAKVRGGQVFEDPETGIVYLGLSCCLQDEGEDDYWSINLATGEPARFDNAHTVLLFPNATVNLIK